MWLINDKDNDYDYDKMKKKGKKIGKKHIQFANRAFTIQIFIIQSSPNSYGVFSIFNS